jgi:hypothetical protein
MEFNQEAFRAALSKERNGKPYEKFANETGLNKDMLYRIENGGTPKLCTLYKLLTHFGWETKQFETK